MEPFTAAETAAKKAMREMLAQLAHAHQEEVQQLRQQVAQLASSLQQMHGIALCARIDEPELDSVRREVAAELALGRWDSTDGVGFSEAHQSVWHEARQPDLPLLDPAVPPAQVPARQASAPSHSASTEVWMAAKQAAVTVAESRNHSGMIASKVCSEATATSKKCRTSGAGSTSSSSRKNDENPGGLTVEEHAEKIRREALSVVAPATRRRRRIGLLYNRGRAGKYGVQGIVEHPAFESICAVMILLNSFLVGFDVQWLTVHDKEEFWSEMASYGCNLFFLMELLMRFHTYRMRFFVGENMSWNIFDSLLVIISIVEFFISDRFAGRTSSKASANIGTGMKAVKMLRIARVFRVFRFCKELSLLALMILDSMKSLMWALLMLTIILYVFAICFTQNATDFIKSGAHMQPAPLELSEVYRQFGSLHRTVYSLLQAMLGGISWGVASDALFAIHWTSAVLFFFYIFFTMLAVLNIITGVFVDNAVETAKTQRDFLVQKEMELKERYLAEMKELFIEMDEDGSGTVSLAEVQEYFADPRVQSYFAALGLDPADTERLFNLLDCNEDGECDVEEFLDGCLRLKGVARSIDVQQLLVEFKKFHKQVEQLDKGIREASLVNCLGSQHSLLSSHAGSPTV